MKKQFLLASLAAMAATPSFSAGFKPFIKGESTTPTRHVSVRAASKAPVSPQTVVDEDFSRLTQGSEENPVLINLDGYYIPDNLTAQPGWTGKAVAEAMAQSLFSLTKMNTMARPTAISTLPGCISTGK